MATGDLYGGTDRLLETLVRPLGIETTYMDTSDLDAVRAALDAPGVKGILVESPARCCGSRTCAASRSWRGCGASG